MRGVLAAARYWHVQPLVFEQHEEGKPEAAGIDTAATLKHFALVTYAIPPARLERVMANAPSRLSLVTVDAGDGPRALVSAVVFRNEGFGLAAYPSPKLDVNQINYRTYVYDREAEEVGVWFIGTLLDSWAVAVPRYVWKLPWRRGSIRLGVRAYPEPEPYTRYRMETESPWAPARLELVWIGEERREPDVPGFPDVETGLVCLSHPQVGFYPRLDGRVSTNRVWHERMALRPARMAAGYFGLLERLGLVPVHEQLKPHSVMVADDVPLLSSLPPRLV